MSYILEALKKAESERKLGTVPGMHQPATVAPALEHEASATSWFRWLIAVLILLAIGVVAWTAWSSSAAPGTPSSQRQTLAAATGEPGMVAPMRAVGNAVGVASSPAEEPTTPPAPDRPVAQSALPAPPPALPRPTPRAAEAARTVRVNAPDRKTVRQAAVAADADAPAIAAPADVVSTWRELPESVRRNLPEISIDGYIYSPAPHERSMVVNNRLLREGDQVSPGLKLERMTPRDAVFDFKGTRYRVPY